jgi:hypothetical protein
VAEQDITELHSACAAASRFLWLTPYFGHRFACAADDAVAAGWASGEAAVRYTEAWASLAGQGRFGQMLDKYVRLVRAALRHPLRCAAGRPQESAVCAQRCCCSRGGLSKALPAWRACCSKLLGGLCRWPSGRD